MEPKGPTEFVKPTYTSDLPRFPLVDPVARRGNPFASTARAPTRACELGPVPEHVLAIGAGGRLQDEASGPIPRDRLDDVAQMILNLPFGDP